MSNRVLRAEEDVREKGKPSAMSRAGRRWLTTLIDVEEDYSEIDFGVTDIQGATESDRQPTSQKITEATRAVDHSD